MNFDYLSESIDRYSTFQKDSGYNCDFIKIGTIHDRKLGEVILRIKNYKSIKFRSNIKTKFSEKHLPILKSHIQKCIRRSLTDLALKTAKTMIYIKSDKNPYLGLFELLRRLTVIILEDCIFIEEVFHNLTWLLCSLTKKWIPTISQINYVMNVVNELSNLKYVDRRYHQFSYNCVNDCPNYALQIRLGFSGMKGDQEMFKKIMCNYQKIYPIQFTRKQSNVLFENITLLKPNEMIIEAFDFHCTNLFERVKEYFEIDENEYKRFVWNNISSYTNKEDILFENQFMTNDEEKYTFDIEIILELTESIMNEFRDELISEIK